MPMPETETKTKIETEHNHEHDQSRKNESAVMAGFCLTAGFMAAEFVGGYLSGSLALMADAAHMLVDSGALLLSLAGFYFGRKPATLEYSFGYMRFEILASLANSVLLFCLAAGIIYHAAGRLFHPHEVDALPMLGIAAGGLLVNIAVAFILHRGEKNNLNIKGALYHVIGDMMGSAAAIAAGIIIYYTGWTPADSILSILVGGLLVRSAANLFKGSTRILMAGSPSDLNVEKARLKLMQIPGVDYIEHIHIWQITSGKTLAALDIQVKAGADIYQTSAAVKDELKKSFGIFHSTIGIESGQCEL
jgi:cobalt-zinc-cadmium efflux system protein